MDLNLKETPWRKEEEEIKKFVEGIRRKNGSTPSLQEALQAGDKFVEEAEKVGFTSAQLYFLARHFEFKKPKRRARTPRAQPQRSQKRKK